MLSTTPGIVPRRTGKAGEEAGANYGPGAEDPVDTFTRQARLSCLKLIRRVYEIHPLLCPLCGAEIGTRRRRRRGGAAASSAASLWAGPRLHHRLCHRPRDPPCGSGSRLPLSTESSGSKNAVLSDLTFRVLGFAITRRVAQLGGLQAPHNVARRWNPEHRRPIRPFSHCRPGTRGSR
jgi:hypothetical protein